MSKELMTTPAADEKFDLIADIESTQRAARKLLETKHYQQLGEAGIFAIVQKAKSLRLNVMDALGGGLYFTNGKVGMSAETMNTLIRSHGHSIIKDAKSNDTVCILHGKRQDNGDTWTESFSIDDAKRAGIYKEATPWGKYPRNMCFNRALSNLARQLFPDVIKGCYEIDELRSFADEPAQQTITPFNYSREKELEVTAVETVTEIPYEDREKFYKEFDSADSESARAFIRDYMDKKGCTESESILNAVQSSKSKESYEKWKKKNRPSEQPVTIDIPKISTYEEMKG